MVSAAMVVQEQNGGTESDTRLPSNDKMSLDLTTPDVEGIQLKEPFNHADDFAPKVRKPYTITKQRERWTEEEHKKFLEALKLYGRAWRKIEEHVGTKTAVQIRSHAQKFFSKVVRECNTGEASAVKPIEIPPPRPKRKPMHPYPRKLVSQIKTGISISEQPNGPASPTLSSSEQENQSPTSVLSTVGSDASMVADSCMPSGSLSPISSARALTADPDDENSSQDGRKSETLYQNMDLVKEETLYQNMDLIKEDPNGSARQSLKLFGKTFSVLDSHGPSYPSCKPELSDKSEGTCVYPWGDVPLKFPTTETKGDLFYMQMPSEKASYPVPFPWLTLCGGASLSTLEVHNPTPVKARPSCDKMYKDEQKEGSSTDSNSDLISSSGNGEENRVVKPKGAFSSYKLKKKTSANSVNCGKGFVPYKRCVVQKNSTISSTESTDEREKQRTRLCF
ncbi:hypothetical protein BUALT_Bualt11G0033500 [Buddleja alternifolia]|uniref:Uncharacterized protein n=1 Tax=Buddleja alternifolia TaxID=168488 RepID=A0AAV6WYJ0_9LAMI|nr:hypothetical protein BUALT_Bualt11G0033500 [Buddleja alternifolia]